MPPADLIAFDPGLRCSGISFFADGVLVDARIARISQGAGRDCRGAHAMASAVLKTVADRPLDPPVEVIYERPQVYMSGAGGDPDDVMQLAYVNGAVAGRLTTIHRPRDLRFKGYYARQWKGQVPKNIHHSRVREALDDDELGRLDSGLDGVAASLRHNALDAVGLGLTQVHRL